MRVTRLAISALIALAAAGCLRQPGAYDSATGPATPMVQQYAASQPAPTVGRGLFSSPGPQAMEVATTGSVNGGYQAGAGRGLFEPRSAYNQPPATQPHHYQSYVLQYHPPVAAVPVVPAVAVPYGYDYAPSNYEESYTLGPGDKLRVIVFGQQGISGSYLVDAGGNVSLPLAGTVPAQGLTTHQVAREIIGRLRQGYVRDPHVTVSIEAYRPFFILGEVTTPGQYAYVPNMTVEKAVAVAGGFSPRAYKGTVRLTRTADGQHFSANVPLDYPIRPGDTVVVKERWF